MKLAWREELDLRAATALGPPSHVGSLRPTACTCQQIWYTISKFRGLPVHESAAGSLAFLISSHSSTFVSLFPASEQPA